MNDLMFDAIINSICFFIAVLYIAMIIIAVWNFSDGLKPKKKIRTFRNSYSPGECESE